MGFQDKPQCLFCLARHLDRGPGELGASLFQYIQTRDCFRTAWNQANRDANLPDDTLPPALQYIRTSAGAPSTGAEDAATEAGPPESTAHWDAGDMGCGELVLELRRRLEGLPAGGIFQLRATDPGAPEDLPAWCRLTGHRLVRTATPDYWIRRKE